MRSVVLGAFSAIAMLSTAGAADIYGSFPGGYKDAPYIPGVNWTGFYIGGHFGGAWSTLDVTDVNGWNAKKSFSNDGNGVFGGAQLGYNLQFGRIVAGIEADIAADQFTSKSLDPVNASGHLTYSRFTANYFGDATGRLGASVGKALIYGKGGFAYMGANISVLDTTAVERTKKTDTLTGWTAGGGVEYAVSPAWSVKAEYLHFDFGSESLSFIGAPDRWKNDITVDTAKLGVNYRFGRTYEPLK